MNVKVRTSVAKDFTLLDRVSINYPLRFKPVFDSFPVYDISKYGDATRPYPNQFGSLEIHPNTGFKIIEIVENPRDFTSILKLRQIGTEIGDGTFSERGPALYDFAVYGDDVYGANEDIVYEGIYGVGLYDDSTTKYS